MGQCTVSTTRTPDNASSPTAVARSSGRAPGRPGGSGASSADVAAAFRQHQPLPPEADRRRIANGIVGARPRGPSSLQTDKCSSAPPTVTGGGSGRFRPSCAPGPARRVVLAISPTGWEAETSPAEIVPVYLGWPWRASTSAVGVPTILDTAVRPGAPEQLLNSGQGSPA
jgi:hypothetical protein